MKMKLTVTILSVIFFVFNGYGGEITFNEALDSMYGSHEGIAQSKADLEQKKFDKKAALGLYSPRFSLNAFYGYFGRDLTIDVDMRPIKDRLNAAGGSFPVPLPIGSLFPDTISQTVQNEQFFTLNASMLWPVFTGGRIYAANTAAKANYNIAQAGMNSKYSELGSQLAESYFSLRLANEVIALKKEVVNSMNEHYRKALKLEKAGMLAKVERLHAEMALSNAERSLEESQRDARLAVSALKSLINSNDDNITPSTPLFIIGAENIEPLVYFQDLAAQTNPKIKQIDGASELARAGVINSRASFMPHLNVFAMANIYDYELSTLSPDVMVGVQMSINVFDGLQNYHKYKSSKSAENSVKLLHARAEKDIRTLVEQQYITMENARADYVSNEKTIAFAEEYLRARNKAFSQGMATSLDVVDAELALSNAKMAAILAAYKFDIALVKLLATSNTFSTFETYRAKAYIEPGLK